MTKLNPGGSALAYSTYLGGSGGDSDDPGDTGVGIAVDRAGSAYVTGRTDSRNFPTTAGAFDRSYDGRGDYGDAFVTKLNAAGSALAYSTYLGGRSGYERGGGIAVDRAGSAYVTGTTDSRNFPTTAGAFDRSSGSGGEYGDAGDAFVTKLNPAGSALAYSTYLGGSSVDGGDAAGGVGIAVRAGRAYVTGDTQSTDFPTTTGAFDRRFAYPDAFVTKLDLIAGAVRCWVPRVVGMTLAEAKRTIRAMDCSVGRIHRVRSKRVGRVLAQSPKAGSVRRRGFRVDLIVGRR